MLFAAIVLFLGVWR